MDTKTPELTVGVDVGGMKIMAGIFDEDWRRLYVVRRSTKRERGPDEVAARIVHCIEDVVDEADARVRDLRAVGIGVPGTVAQLEGRVLRSTRLGWADFPLGSRIAATLGVPVFVDNECNLATVGAYLSEARMRSRRVLGIFVGTTIGGGMIVDGSLCRDFTHVGGELGHLVVDPLGPECACGKRGCLEALASRTAIVARIREGIAAGRRSQLSEIFANGPSWRSKDLRRAFRGGDNLVIETALSAARWIGRAIGTLAGDLRPEVVLLGGGMIEALGDEMLVDIVREAEESAAPDAMAGVRILTSTLGDEACLTGAARFAHRLVASGSEMDSWS